MLRTLLPLTALAAALIWAAVAGTVAARRWPEAAAAIERTRDDGIRGCAYRYPEPAARGRCEILFGTQYIMERNIALAGRVIIVLGPALAAAFWAYLARRKPPTRKRPRP